jgi:hypothetical protein
MVLLLARLRGGAMAQRMGTGHPGPHPCSAHRPPNEKTTWPRLILAMPAGIGAPGPAA